MSFVLEDWCYSYIKSPFLQDYVLKIMCITYKNFKDLSRMHELINATLVARNNVIFWEISKFNPGCLQDDVALQSTKFKYLFYIVIYLKNSKLKRVVFKNTYFFPRETSVGYHHFCSCLRSQLKERFQ